MEKKYKSKKALIISNQTKFPDDWWNYWVNPILGYYVPKQHSKPYKRKELWNSEN